MPHFRKQMRNIDSRIWLARAPCFHTRYKATTCSRTCFTSKGSCNIETCFTTWRHAVCSVGRPRGCDPPARFLGACRAHSCASVCWPHSGLAGPVWAWSHSSSERARDVVCKICQVVLSRAGLCPPRPLACSTLPTAGRAGTALSAAKCCQHTGKNDI